MTALLRSWKATPNRKAFVLTGSKGTGKTHIVDEFGRGSYRYYLRLDFSEHPDLCNIFGNGLDAETLHRRLRIEFPDFGISKGESLLFLDEVQFCPEARLAIKPLVADGTLDVIAARSVPSVRGLCGSGRGRRRNEKEDPASIDFSRRSLSPTGYEWFHRMHPMDFEEYLWALGMDRDITETIRSHIRERRPFDDSILGSIERRFIDYVVTGGMPEAVLASMDPTPDKDEFIIQRTVLSEYAYEASRMSPSGMGDRAGGCLDSVTGRLCETNKKFTYTDAEGKKNVGWREYAEPISWLESSGIVSVCRNVSEPVRPLDSRTGSCLKMYMCDTGLLLESMGSGTRAAFFRGDHGVNNGGIIENAVANMIERCGFNLYYFSRDKVHEDKERERIEIDFIVDTDGPMAAVEVKSGNNRRSPSLNKLMTDKRYAGYDIGRFIKLENSNIFTDERGVEHYPLFAAAFMDSMFEKMSFEFVNNLELNL